MKHLFFSSTEHYRHERKFYIEDLQARDVEQILRAHPAFFSEIYHQRAVNNIYFDSPLYGAYLDNVNGVCRRIKARIRWYGELFGHVAEPVLELKLRDSLRVGKLPFPLPPLDVNSDLSISDVRQLFRDSGLHDLPRNYLMELNFSLLNRYDRKYFLSADKKFRVTIDSKLRAYEVGPLGNSFLHHTRDVRHTILELKYDEVDEVNADGISNGFPFRMTRSSKYVRGVSELLSH